ncbi:MAG TPA: hypothetical protein VMA36_02050 [Candidatus Limnocylindria bacterium]|nr:hypothetical protein [Candidatus Limnocylindria bacterium]
MITSSASPSSFASIVNGQAWPLSFRPYSPQVWNHPLPASPQSVDAASSSRLRAYLVRPSADQIVAAPSQDYSHPIYYAAANDPSVSVDCKSASYGCSPATLPSFHIPAKARPAGGSDHHLAVIQPNGDEIDLWNAHDPGRDWQNGDTISTAIAVQTSITGNGVPTVKSATSGAALAAGLIRFDELTSGTIPHALFVVLPCTNGHRFPGTTDAMNCADGQGVPVGAQIYLALSDAQIDALPPSTVPAALRPVAHALHQYGAFVEDTGGGGSATESAHGPAPMYESETQYAAMGATYPGIAFAQSHGYTSSGSGQFTGPGINWPALAPYLQVLAPCYSAGTCAQ